MLFYTRSINIISTHSYSSHLTNHGKILPEGPLSLLRSWWCLREKGNQCAPATCNQGGATLADDIRDLIFIYPSTDKSLQHTRGCFWKKPFLLTSFSREYIEGHEWNGAYRPYFETIYFWIHNFTEFHLITYMLEPCVINIVCISQSSLIFEWSWYDI